MDNFDQVKAVLDEATRRALDLMNSPDWEDIGEVDDVYCSRRQTESGIYMSKSIGVINHSADEICRLLWTFNRKKEWDDSLDHIYVVREFNESCRIMYQRFSAPWPVSYRDFVIATRYETVDDCVFLVGESVEAGVAEVDGVVRGEVIASCYKLKKLSPNATEVTYMTGINPKGSIPTMVINAVGKKQCLIIGKLRTIMG
jgi:hypothetical protein